jgi:hypothetical protein
VNAAVLVAAVLRGLGLTPPFDVLVITGARLRAATVSGEALRTPTAGREALSTPTVTGARIVQAG